MLNYYITYLLPATPPITELHSFTWHWFEHYFKSPFYLVLGGLITYIYQVLAKHFDKRSIALNAVNYLALILLNEKASLQGIADFIAERDNKSQQKAFIRANLLTINQETIEKFMLYKKFYKFDYANPIQRLISAEQSYRKCFELIHEYN